MKKSIFFLAALLTLSFAACSDKNEPSNDTASGEQSGGSGQYHPTADIAGDGWEYVAYRNILRITKSGAMDNYTKNGAPWHQYSEAIKEIELPEGLTTIGEYAFQDCWISEVKIPASVTSIGGRAFLDCGELTTVTIASGSELSELGRSVFYGCNRLSAISLPSTLTKIGDLAFYNCTMLSSISIPDAVTSIGRSAFDGCTSLTSVSTTTQSKLQSIGREAFNNCRFSSFKTGNDLKSIGALAFAYNQNLKTVILSENLSAIGDSAFLNCSALETLTLKGTFTVIPIRMLYSCSSLTKVVLPQSVTEIKLRAFEGCTKLATLGLAGTNEDADFLLSPNLKIIGEYAFSSCKALKSIAIGYSSDHNNDITIGRYAFEKCYGATSIGVGYSGSPHRITMGNYVFSNCTGAKSISLGQNVIMGTNTCAGCYRLETFSYSGTDIPQETCYKCTGLTKINIPYAKTIQKSAFQGCTSLKKIGDGYGLSTLQSIGDSAFKDCSVLETMPYKYSDCSSLKSIGKYAFYMCSKMTNLMTIIVIPEGVTKVDHYSFYGCSMMDEIKISSTVTGIATYAFANCSKLATVTCYNTTPPTLANGAFAQTPSGKKLYVPSSAVTTYKNTTNWKDAFGASNIYSK